MSSSRLRLILLAGAALYATGAAAQDAPAPIRIDPAPSLREVQPTPPPGAPAIVVDPSEVPVDADPAQALNTAAPETPAIPAEWSPAPTDADGRSAYGLYLSGRVAAMRGDRETSAEFLTRSQALTPEQPSLTNETFLAALLAGDLDSVARLSEGARDLPLADAGRLAVAADALRRGEAADARARLAEAPLGMPFERAAMFLAPALAAGAGDWDAALAPVAENAAEPTTALSLRDSRARLLEVRRRFDDAETEYQALMALPNGRRLYGVHYGAFLERRGRKDDAREAYLAALAGPNPDPRVLADLERLNNRGRAPEAPTLTDVAADALSFAALEASELGGPELAIIYLQLSLALHEDDAVTLRLAQALGRAEQEGLAKDTYARVGRANAIQFAASRIGLAELLTKEDKKDEALAVLREADEVAKNQPAVARALAAALMDSGQYDAALEVLNRPSINVAGQSPEFHFLRGHALSQLNRLDEAEAELWTALLAAPDNPTLLNQLGYMWVDSGRRIEQGAEMLARAHLADPENGNIQDSLGWAQYRQGNYETAVETLEQAVNKQPSNAEIVDHLGDAYWQVGRRREAEWQWNRVLTLDPEAERRAEVERKLESGMPIQVIVPEAAAASAPAPTTAGEP